MTVVVLMECETPGEVRDLMDTLDKLGRDLRIMAPEDPLDIRLTSGLYIEEWT